MKRLSLAVFLLLGGSAVFPDTPWWDDFPRIVQTDSLSTALSHHATISFTGALRDPGWGLYGQQVTYLPWHMDQFQYAGLKNIGYFETYGQSLTFIAEIDPGGGTDFTPMLHSFWNWQEYGGGEIAWIGVHNFFDDMDFARPYTRTHPRYGGPPMYYPDGTIATGFDGDPTDPRNHRVYDAACAKTILGDLSLDYGYNPTVNEIDPQSGQPIGPLDGLLHVPEDDQYAGLLNLSKDPACPYWIDFTYASTLHCADEGLDGMWTDNFSAWDGFGIFPVKNAFGEWSVARFRDYLDTHFSASELASMGIVDVQSFDVRDALIAKAIAWGGDPTDLDDPVWRDPRWLDDTLWHAYLVHKRQTGEEALSTYYHTAKAAAQDGGIDEFLVCGNDMPGFSLGWARGDLDMVSTEMSASWNLAGGPQGFMIPPVGRLAPFYKLAREHAKSRFVNVWFYTDGYETELAQTGVSTTMYYEMLATHALPMFYPLSQDPTVAGTTAGNEAFFEFVTQAAPTFGQREPVAEIGVYYSSSSVLARFTPGGTFEFANQPHRFAHWGWSTALGELHHQYRPVPEWKLSPETLAGLRLLIVPNCEVFDPSVVNDVLAPWVHTGGRLIVTATSGRRLGEADHFAINPGGYTLAPLTGVSDIASAPPIQTQTVGHGLVHYLRDNIGQPFFDASATRQTLLPQFADAINAALVDSPPVAITPGPGVTQNVGLTLYEDRPRRRLFVDANNFAINPLTDAITPTASLEFTIRAPEWLATCDLQSTVVSPQSPPPTAEVEIPEPGVIAVSLSPIEYFASVMIEPTSLADTDGDGVSDVCDTCPDSPADFPIAPDGCRWTTVDDTILCNIDGAVAGRWQASRTQPPPDLFHDGDPASAGTAVLSDASLAPNPNHPLVGDINGDGITDLAVVGYDTNLDKQVFLGRITGLSTTSAGHLAITPPTLGWPSNAATADPDASTFFLADVDGDGRDDAIAVGPLANNSRWEAHRSSPVGLSNDLGATSCEMGYSVGHYFVGDFNADGCADIGMRSTLDDPGRVTVVLSQPGAGLVSAPTPGQVSTATTEDPPNVVATLVGDINGDGFDDTVVIDDRWYTGQYVWVADLTAPADTPSGIELGAGGKSWAYPFSESDPPSAIRIPMLADFNGDGLDDLVEYREFEDSANPGHRFGQWVVAFTDPQTGDLFNSTFDEASTIALTPDEVGNVALIGHFNFRPRLELCTNGIDDDGDGLADCADTDCDTTFDCICGTSPHDLNNDGNIDAADLPLMIGCLFGPNIDTGGGTCWCADMDRDDDVDMTDIAAFATCFGGGCAQ